MRAYGFLNINEPWIAWLVARGVIVSAPNMHSRALSVWHAKFLQDAATSGKCLGRFGRELRLEHIRHTSFPSAVPRLTGLYMFPTLEIARAAGNRWDAQFADDLLTELDVVGTAMFSRCDSEFITHDFFSTDESWMPRYWGGDQRDTNPTWELLVHGRAVVLNQELRQRATIIVAETWPAAVSLLHLARAAAELKSDLGAVVPMLIQRDGTLHLDFTMNFEDAKNPAFLDRLGKYRGEADLSLLARSNSFNTPDFRRYAVSLSNSA